MIKILIISLLFPVFAYAEWIDIHTYEEKDGYTIIIDREYEETDIINIYQEKQKEEMFPIQFDPCEWCNDPPPKQWVYDIKTDTWHRE